MTRDRIRSLDELGFEWELNPKSCTWEECRQQLAVVKKEVLHTNVPQNYAKNKPLGKLVNNQRTQYKLLKASKKSHMTRKQIRIWSLDKLGFEWEICSKPCTWEERHQQLSDFKDEFLHTNVPRYYEENKPLGTWVTNQRIYSTSCSKQVKRVTWQESESDL